MNEAATEQAQPSPGTDALPDTGARQYGGQGLSMKLRTLILSFLLVFALVPLMAAIVINVPLVFGQLELFYHKAHLQNLRADFRDLDQHLASRHEMLRLLAKLPDATPLLEATPDATGQNVARAKRRYRQSINRILPDQIDIIQVLLLDRHGRPRFWLERDASNLRWQPTEALQDRSGNALFEAGMRLSPGGVLVSPIRVNPLAGAADPRRLMNLQMVSPIFSPPLPVQTGPEHPIGAVVINLDVGGMARAYRNTYWVRNDGHYLRQGETGKVKATAFDDFPGLEDDFHKRELALWKGRDNEQVIWVPLFATEHSGPLWVGRQVDPSPISLLRHALGLRVAGIVLAIIVIVSLAARWFALRAERLGRELTEGIGKVLENDAPVHFAWRRPQELRALADNLTRLAETHAGNSQALRAHAAELEESNRYKSEFLANVSHELRTPLNSILLLSKLIANDEDHRLSGEQRKQASVIHEAGSDLRALIDDILDLSRIEARRTTFRLEEIDLPRLLSGLIDLVRPQADAHGLSLQLELDEDAPRSIVSDADKLRQILKNFLSNALKFTRRGGITVRLQGCPTGVLSAQPVQISVADTGIGIPESKHDVIFEAFKQADGSTRRRYGGTGLGLTISRELATLVGGRIELQSQEGGGSTFSLFLPRELDLSHVDEEQVSTGHGGKSSEAPGTRIPEADFLGRRILVVDDDVRNLLALTPLLERWNLEVTGAGDGSEALETLDDDPDFDLVLMDIMMPGMDGYETIEQIRAQDRFLALPIVALTAKAGEEDRERSLAAGADDYLAKPVEPGTLVETLGRHLTPAKKPSRDIRTGP